jgi:hypothetical protein
MRGTGIFWEAFWDGFTMAGLTGSSRLRPGPVYKRALVVCSVVCVTATLGVIGLLIANRSFAAAATLLGGAAIVAGASFVRRRRVL